MRRIRALLMRMGSLFGGRGRDAEVAEEMQSHLELHIRDNLRAGMTPVEARRRALIALGGIEQTKEMIRDRGGVPALEVAFRDLGYAARVLRASPGFTVVAILMLALGIGASAAAFSVLRAVVLRPLPYPDADRLVFLRGSALTSNNFSTWQQHTSSYEALAAMDPGLADVQTAEGPVRLYSLVVSREFFPLLGLRASSGRVLLEGDYRDGTSVVLSDRFARQLFGTTTAAIGRPLRVVGTGYSNERFEVVGTFPALGPLPYNHIDLILPLLTMPREEFSPALARLKPGISPAVAQAEAAAMARAMTEAHPPRRGELTASVEPLKARVLRDSAVTIQLIFAAALLVLLIACGNVAHLVLARSTARSREVAVRMALGASRMRVAMQLFWESVLLCGVAAAAGFVLSTWAVQLLTAVTPYEVPRLAEAHTDAQVLAFVVAASMIISVAFATVPLMQAAGLDLNVALKQGARQIAGSQRQLWLRALLVSSEVAIACVVLVVAGLLVNTFLTLRPAHPGFNPHHKLILRVGNTRGTDEQSVLLGNELQRRLGALPGVRAVATSTDLPMTGMTWVPEVRIGEQTVPGGGGPNAIHFRAVSTNYFDVMEMQVAEGRSLDAVDAAQRLPVALVNEQMARRYLGSRPMGAKLSVVSGSRGLPELTVIGVLRDARIFGDVAEARPEVYIPFSLAPYRGFWVVVDGGVLPGASEVRSLVREAAPEATITEMQTMDELLAQSVEQPRFHAVLLGALAALAAALAMAGIYAVLSHSVAQRRHEMGVRMAVGAGKDDIAALVMKRAVRLAAAGIVAGTVATLAVSRLLTAVLYGTAATDWRSYLGSAIALLGLAVLAAYLPARRAAAVDPMIALRDE